MSDRSGRMSDGHMKDQRITVRFSPETRRRLKAAARRGGTRESDLVRGAVELQLAAEEASLTAYEHAKKSGLIGAVKGTTRDLSTNPKYFDGFGGSWPDRYWWIPARLWPSWWNPMSTMKRVSSAFITSRVRC